MADGQEARGCGPPQSLRKREHGDIVSVALPLVVLPAPVASSELTILLKDQITGETEKG